MFITRRRIADYCGQVRHLPEIDKMTEDLIHGSIVSLIAEDMVGVGTYGTCPATPTMVWPGMTTGFSIPVKYNYDETTHLAAHGATRLERIRNTKLGEELPFSAEIYPQKTQDCALLKYIVGGAAAYSDSVDSTTWIKELDGDYSVYSGIMLEGYKIDIPEHGLVKQTLSGFAGNQEAPTTAPVGLVEATENVSDILSWEDISSLKMDTTATPSTAIDHCIGDISLNFSSVVAKRYHPESTLSTKMCGVKVMARKLELSFTFSAYVDETFLTLVSGGTKQNVLLTIGATPNATTFTCKGLLWPEYDPTTSPDELIGQTVTALVDQPSFTYVTA